MKGGLEEARGESPGEGGGGGGGDEDVGTSEHRCKNVYTLIEGPQWR